MKRIFVIALFVAIAFAAMPSVAPAEANPLVSVGVLSQGGQSVTFGYAEADLTATLTASVEYRSDNLFALGLWHGIQQGVYGQLEFQSGAGNGQVIELGVWRALSLADTAEVLGWIGARSDLGKANLWAKASAEVGIGLTDSVAIFVGADTTLLKETNQTSTWFGLGYYF